MPDPSATGSASLADIGIEIDLSATASMFLPGHCLRLEVSSSNFPKFDRNSNAAVPAHLVTRAQLVPAMQTVHHDRRRPSSLVLPVI